MKPKDKPRSPLSLLGLTELVCWIGILSIALLAWFLPLTPESRRVLIILAVCAAIIVGLVLHWFNPISGKKKCLYYLAFASPIFLIAYLSNILEPYQVPIGMLYITVVASTGIILGREAAFQATLLSVIAETTTILLRPSIDHANFYILLSLQILVLLLSGIIVSTLSGLFHEKRRDAEQHNRYLSTLLQVGMLASKPGELGDVLTLIAEMITRDVPVSFCRIDLLNPQAESGGKLVTFGGYPIRQLNGWEVSRGKEYLVAALPPVQQAFAKGTYQLLDEEDILTLKNYPLLKANACDFYFHGTKTICVLPLIARSKRLGVVSVGEVRRWDREPFSQEKINFLQTLATQISAAIYSAQSYQEAQRHSRRLEVVNEVARAISSTIEMDQLLELIYEQLSRVIPTETYFVALYAPEEAALDFRILIDDGQRFVPTKVPVGPGLASYVINQKHPLLIHHLSEEADKLPARPVSLGVSRPSESWLGVPILSGERALGILVVASYAPYAFDGDDLTLLTNVAAQAALALDNARQHAAVKEQARRDSMTGAYNHSYFLQLLTIALDTGKQNGTPVSLIMLDVDNFKDYNDRYGHLVGDNVLTSLVEAIQSHIKETDFVGRWGGEEFAIGLPGSDTQEAHIVADQIRLSLAAVHLQDTHNRDIPRPTVSQGIAAFPMHATDPFGLVDVADIALYEAKNAGRDQVVLAIEPKAPASEH